MCEHRDPEKFFIVTSMFRHVVGENGTIDAQGSIRHIVRQLVFDTRKGAWFNAAGRCIRCGASRISSNAAVVVIGLQGRLHYAVARVG